MKIEIANKIETMIRNEEKHLDWLQSNSAPQEFIELSRWHIVHYAERLKEYRESLATPQKEVLGSGNAMGTTKILVANSKGEEIFKIKDDIITINMSNMESKKVTLNNGTVLEEGGRYFNLHDKHYTYFEVLKIGNESYFYRFSDGKESYCEIDLDEDLIPYTEPTPQKEWKTFMIEIDWNGYTTREIVQCESLEIAERHYNGAISITEVKLTIEPVNS